VRNGFTQNVGIREVHAEFPPCRLPHSPHNSYKVPMLNRDFLPTRSLNILSLSSWHPNQGWYANSLTAIWGPAASVISAIYQRSTLPRQRDLWCAGSGSAVQPWTFWSKSAVRSTSSSSWFESSSRSSTGSC
jgi:hypothetical protein